MFQVVAGPAISSRIVWNVPPFWTAVRKQRNLVPWASRLSSLFLAIVMYYWRHFPDIAKVVQIWSTLAGYEELAVGFNEPIRNGEIFWRSCKVMYFNVPNMIITFYRDWNERNLQQFFVFILTIYLFFWFVLNTTLLKSSSRAVYQPLLLSGKIFAVSLKWMFKPQW